MVGVTLCNGITVDDDDAENVIFDELDDGDILEERNAEGLFFVDAKHEGDSVSDDKAELIRLAVADGEILDDDWTDVIPVIVDDRVDVNNENTLPLEILNDGDENDEHEAELLCVLVSDAVCVGELIDEDVSEDILVEIVEGDKVTDGEDAELVRVTVANGDRVDEDDTDDVPVIVDDRVGENEKDFVVFADGLGDGDKVDDHEAEIVERVLYEAVCDVDIVDEQETEDVLVKETVEFVDKIADDEAERVWVLVTDGRKVDAEAVLDKGRRTVAEDDEDDVLVIVDDTDDECETEDVIVIVDDEVDEGGSDDVLEIVDDTVGDKVDDFIDERVDVLVMVDEVVGDEVNVNENVLVPVAERVDNIVADDVFVLLAETVALEDISGDIGDGDSRPEIAPLE